MNKENKRIIGLLAFTCALFIVLVVYLSYFQVFKASDIIVNSYNKRLWVNEEKVLRGDILDRRGVVLAHSERDGETNRRIYNYNNLYSHIIGYNYREYGKAGLELTQNNVLLNISETTPWTELKNLILPNDVGKTIELTIDHRLQEYSRNQLLGKKGSIIVSNPKTGEIYSMVSLPDFNPTSLKQDWSTIVEDEDGPLLNRAISGLYEPGSIFKIVTATGLLEDLDINKEYQCQGSTLIDGYTFEDYGNTSHGDIDLEEAIVKSCNTYFAEKGLLLGKDKLQQVAERYMFNKDIPFDLNVKKSELTFRGMGDTDLAAMSFGQGRTLVTPINMSLVASGIANRGEIMAPYLIKGSRERVLSQNTDVFTANILKDMMVEVVERGTGTNAKINNVKVAGKTGTAENPSKKNHAWFMGFAPADNPIISVVVVLEQDGTTGGSSAAPIGRNLIIEGLNLIEN